MGTILLCYKYMQTQYLPEILKWQKEPCTALSVAGQTLIAHEVIKGSVKDSDDATHAYTKTMNKHPLFDDIDFKFIPSNTKTFLRTEISAKYFNHINALCNKHFISYKNYIERLHKTCSQKG